MAGNQDKQALKDESNHSDSLRSESTHGSVDGIMKSPTMDATAGLPVALRLLFGLNGLTLSLSMIPNMYILNTRVALPLALLPAYGSIAFLPYSLKPIYALWTRRINSRYRGLLMSSMLTISCVLTAAWVFLPATSQNENAKSSTIVFMFGLGFAQGVSTSWAEFVLGYTMVELAACLGGPTTASFFQSQASTSRSLGSLFASILPLFVYGYGVALSDRFVNCLLLSTALMNLVGAFLACANSKTFQVVQETSDAPPTAAKEEQGGQTFYFEGSDRDNTDRCEGETPIDPCPDMEDNFASDDTTNEQDDAQSSQSIQSVINVILVGLLQLSVIALALRGPILEKLHSISFAATGMIFLFLTILAILVLYYCTRIRSSWDCRKILLWQPTQRVGLYLILRYSLPIAFNLTGSYVYTRLASTPLWLQANSLVASAMTALSSWSYQHLFAKKYSHDRPLHLLIIGTTTLASLVGAWGNLSLFYLDIEDFPWKFLLIQCLIMFTGEWKFLPDLILATVSVSAVASSGDDREKTMSNAGMEYGSLVACIDLGDQLGAMLTTSIVAALGISRENDFEHLDQLILICYMSTLASVVLVGILPRNGAYKQADTDES